MARSWRGSEPKRSARLYCTAKTMERNAALHPVLIRCWQFLLMEVNRQELAILAKPSSNSGTMWIINKLVNCSLHVCASAEHSLKRADFGKRDGIARRGVFDEMWRQPNCGWTRLFRITERDSSSTSPTRRHFLHYTTTSSCIHGRVVIILITRQKH